MRYLEQLYNWVKSIEPYHFSSKFHCDPFFSHFTPSSELIYMMPNEPITTKIVTHKLTPWQIQNCDLYTPFSGSAIELVILTGHGYHARLAESWTGPVHGSRDNRKKVERWKCFDYWSLKYNQRRKRMAQWNELLWSQNSMGRRCLWCTWNNSRFRRNNTHRYTNRKFKPEVAIYFSRRKKAALRHRREEYASISKTSFYSCSSRNGNYRNIQGVYDKIDTWLGCDC